MIIKQLNFIFHMIERDLKVKLKNKKEEETNQFFMIARFIKETNKSRISAQKTID